MRAGRLDVHVLSVEASRSRNLWLISIKRSSVPQAIQSKCSCSVAVECNAGNCLSNSSVMPPELNANADTKSSQKVLFFPFPLPGSEDTH
jgi:hypothetical protein